MDKFWHLLKRPLAATKDSFSGSEDEEEEEHEGGPTHARTPRAFHGVRG
jgi:hypothetical protein